MRGATIALALAALIASALFAFNASFLAPPSGALTVLAHRGVHQRFSAAGLANDTCTATRIFPPRTPFIENTLPSIAAAFAEGADQVEIDVHPTKDGEFAVFHDWTLDCRTNGRGVTREQTMAYLKTLDVGHGYTADGGKTFPFRDKAVGAMPTLAEVLAAFPHARFLVNTKSRDPSEAEKLDAYLRARPALNAARLTFFSDGRLADRLRALRPDARITNRDTLASCAAGYVALGWLGAVPAACRNTIVFVPANLAWIAWGWPNRFLARMRAVGTEVCVVAPLRRGVRPGGGLDDVKALAALPRNWRGCVSTDAVEIVGPALKSRTT